MSTLQYTLLEDIPKIHQRALDAFRSHRTKSVSYRKRQIAQVGYLLKDNEERIIEALKQDLGRHPDDTVFFDLTPTYIEVRTAYDNVEKWVKTQNAEFHLNFAAMNPKLRAEPKGVMLIIAPFNVPVFLSLCPLVGAIAAGNAAVVKPSEQTPATSALLAELIPKYLDSEMYHVINGGIPETTKILELQWAHIMYTGNGRVGRIIAQAAARHLTPLTLELGGKNPVVVDPKCDVQMAAKRILWGRFSNAGQFCLCPDYVLVPESFQEALVEEMKEAYKSFYPHGPENSDSFCRIVTMAHAERIRSMLDKTRGKVVLGGSTDVSRRYIAPTVVRDVPAGDSLMEDEIFGPVLPIVLVKSIDDAIEFINARDHPLAVYVFSSDKVFQNKVFDNTESGAAIANETVISCGVPGLPMGGVGASGYGYYTGKHMFDEFTHIRVSLDNPTWVDKLAFGFRFPPYKPSWQLRFLIPSLPPRPSQEKGVGGKSWGLWFVVWIVGAASIVLTRSGRVGFVEQLKAKAEGLSSRLG